ncbi:MAG: sulfatase, partial [Candidatus Sumerlaeota bacterium]
VGNLRGHKGSTWEGGIRVPAIVEWPAAIQPRVTAYPASTMDIFPTIVSILGLPGDVMLDPVDGSSLADIFKGEPARREKPIGFNYGHQSAWIDNEWKLVNARGAKGGPMLVNLNEDPGEQTNLKDKEPQRFQTMQKALADWEASIRDSIAGKDYPSGKLEPTPGRQSWSKDPRYAPHLPDIRKNM